MTTALISFLGDTSNVFTHSGLFPWLSICKIGMLPTQIAVQSKSATVRTPDLMIVTEELDRVLSKANQSLIQFGMPAPILAIEVVSPGEPGEQNYDRDYIEKRREYADRGILEYWIIDPHHQVILVLTLQGQSYQEKRFTGQAAIVSPAFPNLNLTADRVLSAGRL